jgi:hypothetical protein
VEALPFEPDAINLIINYFEESSPALLLISPRR